MKQLKKNLVPVSNTVIFNFIIFAFCTCLLISCSSTKNLNTNYIYFRDGADTSVIKQKVAIIRPNDFLNIRVLSVSLNQEQASIFNIPNNGNGEARGYEVNAEGNVKIPVIGYVKASGLTMDQLQTALEQKLTSYVKNASVEVNFLRFNVNVLGEVKNPGTKTFIGDEVNILEAIGAAGDLTDYGKREHVTVIREENGQKIYHIIDLRDKNLFSSPVYLMQPNDVIYVSPNESKIKNLNIDPEKQRRANLALSITSILLGVVTLALTIIKNN